MTSRARRRPEERGRGPVGLPATGGAKIVHLLAGIGAIGFALHIMLGEPEPTKQARPAPNAVHVEEAYGQTALDNVPPPSPVSAPGESARIPSPPPVDHGRLEGLVESDPEAALHELASALPKSERDAQRLKLVEVRALVAQGKVGAARGRANDYFERWPQGPDITTLEQLTGAHPTR